MSTPPTPSPDEREPFAPRDHYAFSGGFFAPSRIESPLGMIVGGLVVVVLGPAFGAAIWAVSPEPRAASLAVFAAVIGVVLLAIGAFAAYAGWRRRSWRRERGLPLSGRLDPPTR